MLLYLFGSSLLRSPHLPPIWPSIMDLDSCVIFLSPSCTPLTHVSDQFSDGGLSRPGQRDGTVHECISGSDWAFKLNQSLNSFPHSAEVFLELPVDSDILYLFTKGSQAGHLEIEQSKQPTDKVSVHVRVGYHTPEALRGVNVCRLERETRENGVGIYVITSIPIC